MTFGILIGVTLTALAVVLAMIFGKRDFTLLSYIIIAVALIAFIQQGVMCIRAVDDKKNVADVVDNMAAIAETAIAYTGSDVQNYRLGLAEATAVKTGLRFAYPKAARYIEPSDLVGKTLYECTEVLRKSVIRSANSRIWKAVFGMAGILVVAVLLIVFSTNVGGGSTKRKSIPISSDDNYTSNYEDF